MVKIFQVKLTQAGMDAKPVTGHNNEALICIFNAPADKHVPTGKNTSTDKNAQIDKPKQQKHLLDISDGDVGISEEETPL